MVFGLKESTKVADCERSDMAIVDSLFQVVKNLNILDLVNVARIW